MDAEPEEAVIELPFIGKTHTQIMGVKREKAGRMGLDNDGSAEGNEDEEDI